MSVVAKIGLLVSMQWGLLIALMGLGLDRVGKAVRTAPRDVLIAAHAIKGQQGAAFGLHRAMDAVGALAGPLLAFLILAASPENYELLLIISLVFAALGLIALLVKVPPLQNGRERWLNGCRRRGMVLALLGCYSKTCELNAPIGFF
ncbi:hypothetical protein SDC9_158711 [bioreactor metagenome]|uniref:Major facilitator superfamily (MFS) profile domain-containing protein n=1 Tax=bioreactor metagenome TaxID=1076179 RepID=A0A645FBW6_9ZZZZ